MRRIGIFLARGLSLIIVLGLVLGAGGVYYFKSYLPPKSFPQIDGEIKLEGLDGPVDIYRDQMGIPHIYATSSHDIFFAQGYIHAQDRFWQMDAWRHIGSGTLSEMFGKEQIETDMFLRTLGWRLTAEQEYAGLDPISKSILDSYTEGVNAYLKDHETTAVSLEYAVLGLLSPGYKIEKWTPINSLTWGKAIAWDMRGNMDEEVARVILLKTFTPEQVAELYPTYPQDHPVIVDQIESGTPAKAPNLAAAFDIPDEILAALQHNVSLLNLALGPTANGIGSNSWAVSGAHTSTGMPLLANDPHLGIQMPSIWYQAHLECKPVTDECPYNVAGFTFAGVPGVIIGHNNKVAWGFTNAAPDVMDLYIERVNPDNPNQYEINGKWVDFETRTETIRVVGGNPVDITIRLTRHGPVILIPLSGQAGIELPEQYAIALKWTALAPSTPFKAIWDFNRAQNWDDFRTAAQSFHVPAQNLLYADVDGNIGYQMPGDIPIRANGDGTIPVPGWTDDYEWTGFIPFEELPYTFNPPEGYIVTANNRCQPWDYPYLITSDWGDYGFRAQRIVEMIESAPGEIDIAYVRKMQGDSFDSNAPTFVPMLLELDELSDNETRAQGLLKNWDYQNQADSAAAAVFNAFWHHFLQNTFNDDMPEESYFPGGGSRWNEILRHLEESSTWWDDKTTTDVSETRDDIIRKSFEQGSTEVEKLFGKDPRKWNWGEMHTSTFRNGTLGVSGVAPIDALFNRGPFPTSGGSSSVNATSWSLQDGYETNWLPSMRMIVDLGNLNNSLTVHTTGQSGHAYHLHYDDMSSMWANIEYYSMLWDQQAITSQAEGHLVLKPK